MSVSAPKVDVVIVGLGPAGATAARVAAAGGASVLALERKRIAGHPVQCAELIPRLLAKEAGDAARAVRQEITQMKTFVESGTADEKPDFPGYMIDRDTFDANLVADARAAGAECRLEAMVRAVDDAGHIYLASGERLQPRLIIGADGPRSLIGRAIGAQNTELVETRQVSVKLCGTYAATDIFLSAAIPGGYGWMFPKREKANVGVGVFAHRKGELKSLVENLHERLVQEGRVGRAILATTGGAIPVGGIIGPVGRLHQSPVLLAGDAAGLANPITGAGINAAILSGALAGEAALSWLAGHSAALSEYGAELEELFGPGLERALRHRQRMNTYLESGRCLSPADLRSSWIAYEAYWKS